MKLIKKIGNWLKNGNDCTKCKAFSSGQCLDDYYAGCYIRSTKDGDNYYDCGRHCRWPRFLRNAMCRRKDFLNDFLYGEYTAEFVKQRELDRTEAVKEFNRALDGYIIYQKSYEGPIVCDKDEVINELSERFIVDPSLVPPSPLSRKWAELLRDTLKAVPFNIKSLFYKKT